MRYFLEISFDGSNYHGWQKQPKSQTIQQTIEDCISILLKDKINIVSAGRTDSGVHAKEMIAHFDYKNKLDLIGFTHRLDSFLPHDISVNKIFQVNHESHARFSAISRLYEYHISQKKNPLLHKRVFQFKNHLDINLMNKAAKILCKHQDFESFSKSNSDVKTFNCNIMNARWESNNDILIFSIKADRFLRNMVRAVVGTLIEVGIGKITVDDFEKIILKKNRKFAGYSVPACGLYLCKIEYNLKEILNVRK
ncbi:MAG: tRNA pseudouridine(38-40) synthase TruA [Flavobacteriaceae bacterium]|nr:tRNA pseudouridine(38-40) synthase TruA [Flavobacteriaceae bacterium]MBL6684164.1 tRNA pseudouridine(38-40) synthase TruA [Flavobacteriaceae bacterium]